MEDGKLMKPGLDGRAVQMAAVSTGDLKARHGSAEYIQGIENQRAMKVAGSRLASMSECPWLKPAASLSLPNFTVSPGVHNLPLPAC